MWGEDQGRKIMGARAGRRRVAAPREEGENKGRALR